MTRRITSLAMLWPMLWPVSDRATHRRPAPALVTILLLGFVVLTACSPATQTPVRPTPTSIPRSIVICSSGGNL